MSENPISEAAEAAEAVGAAPPAATENPASLLRTTREARGLSLDDAAKVLKLQPRQVLAMEEGDFPSLGSAPHVRGFVRNYARYLDLDPERVLGLIEHRIPPQHHELHGPGNTGVAMPTPGGRKPLAWALAASPLVLVVLGLGILYAFGVNFDRWRSASGEPAAERAPAAPTPTPTPASAPAPFVAPRSAAGSGPLAPVAAPVVAVPAPPAFVQAGAPSSVLVAEAKAKAKALAPDGTATTAVSAPHRMVLNFLQESWVEIKQADGRSLISEKVAGGNTRIVEGKPPFALVIGNAPAVQLQYDDLGVDLAPHTKVGVARLTLN